MTNFIDKSACHGASVYVSTDHEGTSCYICTHCDKPCDLQLLNNSRTNIIGLGEYSDADLIAELVNRHVLEYQDFRKGGVQFEPSLSVRRGQLDAILRKEEV